MSERIAEEIIDDFKISKIAKLSPIKTWRPRNSNRVIYNVEIDFENGDYVKVFSESLIRVSTFFVGQKYIYRLGYKITVDEDGNEKTSIQLAEDHKLVPEQVEARLALPKDLMYYVSKAAELAVSTFSGDGLGAFTDVEFKDRASTIYDWMAEKRKNLDFGEADNQDLESFIKNNPEFVNNK